MRKIIVVAGLLLLWTQAVEAQQVSDPQAYFQWMLAITDDTLTPRMTAHLSAAGLNGQEAEKAAQILSQFKAEEFGLEASYNNLPSVQAGRNDDTDAFYAKQDDLVQRTITKLRLALIGDGFVRLDKRVQHEAKNIKIGSGMVSNAHHNSMLTPVSFRGHPQRLGMTPNYTYYNTTSYSQATSTMTVPMLTQQGLSQWNAANLIDGDVSDVGFSTSNAIAWNGEVVINFGSGNSQDIAEVGLYMSAAGSNAVFDILYWDPGDPNWILAASNWAPVDAGWNYQGWPDAGAHQQWIVQLANNPGPGGPTINELQLIQPFDIAYTTSQVSGNTNCPDGCPPLARHIGWAQVDIGTTVHQTFGPEVFPTSFFTVSDSESTVLPVDGPPVNVGTTAGVNCTVAGNGFSGTPAINNDIIFATTYSENLFIGCGTLLGLQCVEIIDYCTPESTPPDFDPTQALGSVPIVAAPFFIGHSDCDRPHGAAPGTLWHCIWPTPKGYTLPRGTRARRTCTNTDKRTKGAWPGPW